jgi:uncharacterized DUF497 family protein
MRYHHFFEWDPRKAEANKQKHRVTFEDAVAILKDDQADLYHFERYDDKHSMSEVRYLTTASDPAERRIVLLISWTQRLKRGGRKVTRIISARRANPRERTEYAQATRRK